MYKDLGINVPDLGCVMLDVAEMPTDPYLDQMKERDVFYSSDKPERFWIKGYVAGKTPHVTLLYGLMEQGSKWKKQIDAVLKGWNIKDVEIDHIGFFPSHYKDDPYYCIVGHVKISPELQDGHDRLQLLPHINTFPGYKAHLTLAYVKKDEEIRDWVITNFESWLPGKALPIAKGVNYGGDKK